MDITATQSSHSVTLPQRTADQPSTAPAATGATAPRSALHEVAARYDVRHMTPVELHQMSQELYEAGAIDPFQHRHLSLMASFPWQVERGADGQIRSITPMGLTGPQTPRDFVKVQEEHVAFLDQHGLDSESAKGVLDLLRTLDVLKKGGVDVSA